MALQAAYHAPDAGSWRGSNGLPPWCVPSPLPAELVPAADERPPQLAGPRHAYIVPVSGGAEQCRRWTAQPACGVGANAAPLPFPACSAVQGPCGKALPAASHGAAAGAARAACHGSAGGWCSGHQARQVTGWCARWGFVYAVKLCCDCCFSVASAALARRQCMQVKGFVAMLATLTCYPGAVAACRAAGTSRRAPFRAASSRGPGAAAAACGAAAQDQAQV